MMAFKYGFTNPMPLSSNNQRLNIESCPNSIWLGNPKDKNPKTNVESKSSPLKQESKGTNYVAGGRDNKQMHFNLFGKGPSTTKLPGMSNKPSNINISHQQLGTNSYIQNTDSMAPQYSSLFNYSFPSNVMGGSLFPGYNPSIPLQHDTNSRTNDAHNYKMGIQSRFYPFFPMNNDCIVSDEVLTNGDALPSFFDPRGTNDMEYKEKVNCWIDSIPIYEVQENIWSNECYSNEYSLNWEEIEFDRKSDQFLSRDKTVSLTNSDELLYLQSKKIDCLVRKIYNIEDDDDTSSRCLEDDEDDALRFQDKLCEKGSVFEYEYSSDFV